MSLASRAGASGLTTRAGSNSHPRPIDAHPRAMRTAADKTTAPTQPTSLRALSDEIVRYEALLRKGGGQSGHERQRKLGRLPVRERLTRLLDPDATFLELGLWAGFE